MTKHINLHWLWLAALIIVLDQVVKHLVVAHFSLGVPYPVFAFFNLTLAHNTGAAFSFLREGGAAASWLFAIVAIVVCIFIMIWLIRLPAKKHWLSCSLSLILGGAIGNLIDRVHYGYVVDFLDFYFRNWHYPAFNIADSAICIGAIMLLIDVFFNRKQN